MQHLQLSPACQIIAPTTEEPASLGGIDVTMIAELMAEGAMAHKHPAGFCVILVLPSGPPSLMLSCYVMDQLVADGVVVLGADGVYRPHSQGGERTIMSNQADKSGEQKTAESDVEGFRKDLGPFVVAAETTRMPMVFTDARDPAAPIIFANDSFLALTGCTREEVLGEGFNFLMARGGDPEPPGQIEAAFAGASDTDPEIRYRRHDGSVFWASIFVSPVRDEAGTVVQHFASFVDVTKHKQEHERLRLLLDELNHRTQNTLATVLAIAGQTLRGMADEQTIDSFEGRILALSKTHGLLGAENWDKVGLRDVLDRALETLGLGARVSIEGDEFRLEPKNALTLTMVFHELATNAMAYGALSTDAGGKVDVAWKFEALPEGNQVRLSWRESGGPPVNPPAFKGFGRRLIDRGLAQDLNGEVRLAYEPQGVVCEIVMPVSGGIRG